MHFMNTLVIYAQIGPVPVNTCISASHIIEYKGLVLTLKFTPIFAQAFIAYVPYKH